MHVTLEVSGHMPLLALPWSSSWPNASHTRHELQSSSSYPKWKTCTCGRADKAAVIAIKKQLEDKDHAIEELEKEIRRKDSEKDNLMHMQKELQAQIEEIRLLLESHAAEAQTRLSDEQAAAMVSNWLLSPDHFCIAPEGDMAGNSDSCWWGLPSIEASDPAYPPLGYWRGYVWGPMAQLVHWSLEAYDHVPKVREARLALSAQMSAMMMDQWERGRRVCENFSPYKQRAPACTGDPFYTWGALAGVISFLYLEIENRA